MLSTENLTIQFGPSPIFENITVKFEEGCRYGLIGSQGCGKTTFLKILSGQLKPTSGFVRHGPGQRVSALIDDAVEYDRYSLVDTVMMGQPELWEVKQERDHIFGMPKMSKEDAVNVANLEVKYEALNGDAAKDTVHVLLTDVGIPKDLHHRLMNEIPSNLKPQVLLAHVLFSDADVLLLDEPTKHLEPDQIAWLQNTFLEKKATMIIVSQDRHFLNRVCTHMADLNHGGCISAISLEKDQRRRKGLMGKLARLFWRV